MQNKYPWLGVAVVVIIAAIAITTSHSLSGPQTIGSGASQPQNKPPQDIATRDKTDATPSNAACPADAQLCPDGTSVSRTGPKCDFPACPRPATPQSSGSYLAYSMETLTAEQTAGHKVVLFFHATWCPFCTDADQAFRSHSDDIPTGVTVLKTDYDSQTELKQKYGVTHQHTFVQIDRGGNQVSKWLGGDIANLKKYLQ